MGRYLDEIINEAKDTYGKETNHYTNDLLNKTLEKSEVEYRKTELHSLNSRSLLASKDERNLENFDKQKVKLLIESKNIVEEYKKYIELDLEKILSKSEETSTIMEKNIKNIFKELKQYRIDEKDIKRCIIQDFYEVSDNPKVIKEILQLRINYNNRIVYLLQKMLKTNYKILGISSKEANDTIEGLNNDSSESKNILKIKNIILNNKAKFIKGRIIDLSSLGLGIAYLTKHDMGEFIENSDTLNNNIQILMRYDCVLFAHGGSSIVDGNVDKDEKCKEISSIEDIIENNETKIKNINNEIKELNKNNLSNDEIHQLASRDYNVDKFAELLYIDDFTKEQQVSYLKKLEVKCIKIKELSNDVEKINAELKDKKEKLDKLKKDWTDIIKNKKGGWSWSCQAISTEKAGPFYDVNDMVRECIKEGKRNIYISICNPGHYKLDPDIYLIKGVHIRMAKNSLWVED